MILKLIAVKPMKSLYSGGKIKEVHFRDLESKLIFKGYLSPANPELYNTISPILKIGAHYIGYTWPKRMSLDMKNLTLAAVQPEIFEQTQLDLGI